MVTTAGGHNCRWSQLPVVTTAGGHNCRWSQLPVVTTAGGHNCRWSQLSVFTSVGFHICRFSHLSVFTSVVVHNCRWSQLSMVTTLGRLPLYRALASPWLNTPLEIFKYSNIRSIFNEKVHRIRKTSQNRFSLFRKILRC